MKKYKEQDFEVFDSKGALTMGELMDNPAMNARNTLEEVKKLLEII